MKGKHFPQWTLGCNILKKFFRRGSPEEDYKKKVIKQSTFDFCTEGASPDSLGEVLMGRIVGAAIRLAEGTGFIYGHRPNTSAIEDFPRNFLSPKTPEHMGEHFILFVLFVL